MEGFKDTTKTQYSHGGSVAAKGGRTGPTAVKAVNVASKSGSPVQKKGLGGLLKVAGKSGILGVGGALATTGQLPITSGLGIIQQLLKKKKSGIPLTPAEEKQVAMAPATMNKGGKVLKKRDGGDIGAAVARGNRMQALEAREEAKLMREVPKKGGSVKDVRKKLGSQATPSEIQAMALGSQATPSEIRALQADSKRSRMRGPAGAGYNSYPLIPDVIEGPLRRMGLINRKK